MLNDIKDAELIKGFKDVRMRLSTEDIAKLPQHLQDKIKEVKKPEKKIKPMSWVVIGMKPDGTIIKERAKDVYEEFRNWDKNKGEND